MARFHWQRETSTSILAMAATFGVTIAVCAAAISAWRADYKIIHSFQNRRSFSKTQMPRTDLLLALGFLLCSSISALGFCLDVLDTLAVFHSLQYAFKYQNQTNFACVCEQTLKNTPTRLQVHLDHWPRFAQAVCSQEEKFPLPWPSPWRSIF